MNRNKLNKAIIGILGTAALSVFSTQAAAFGGEQVNLGTFTGTTITSTGHAAPYKSWTDWGNSNFGWSHTGASYAVLQVGSAANIAAGILYDVSLKMTATGTASTALDNPAFSIWTSGTTPVNINGSGVHAFSQVRGPNAGSVSDNDNFTSGNIINSQDGWVGYANSGFVVVNGDGDTLNHGGVNTSSPYVTNPGASSWDYSQTAGLDYALLNIMGLKSGYYLIAAGGSCGAPNPSASCGHGTSFQWDISGSVVSAVPVPGAVWLFGSAMAGLIGVNRRKQAA
jgi:hypothetical protein